MEPANFELTEIRIDKLYDVLNGTTPDYVVTAFKSKSPIGSIVKALVKDGATKLSCYEERLFEICAYYAYAVKIRHDPVRTFIENFMLAFNYVDETGLRLLRSLIETEWKYMVTSDHLMEDDHK